MSDWNEAYTARYDEWAAAMTEDVAFYVSLAREADGPVVELAVGTGRVAVPVAEAIGRRVTGIDASPGMLTQCRTRAAAAGVALDLIETDKRTVFKRVAASLQPGGRFAWNALAFDHTILATGVVNSMWWATKNEWLGLAEVAGLEIEALYGGYHQEPFTENSHEYVFITHRPT